jgi:hypothetical protein
LDNFCPPAAKMTFCTDQMAIKSPKKSRPQAAFWRSVWLSSH